MSSSLFKRRLYLYLQYCVLIATFHILVARSIGQDSEENVDEKSKDTIFTYSDFVLWDTYYNSECVIKRFLTGDIDSVFKDRNLADVVRASFQSRDESLDTILRRGININGVNPDGMSPLLFAMASNRKDAYLRLLKAKADPNSIAVNGMAVIHFASEHCDPFWLATALRFGGDANLMTSEKVAKKSGASIVYSRPPIMCLPPISDGMEAYRITNASLLIAAGADVYWRAGDGVGQLEYSVENGSHGVVRLLVEAGPLDEKQRLEKIGAVVKKRFADDPPHKYSDYSKRYYFEKLVDTLEDKGIKIR